MKLPMNRSIIIGVIALLISATLALAQGGAQLAPRPQMAEEVFKNVTVLKGLPVDEFMGTMGLFSAALSVCCGDCHVGAGSTNPHWDADPPKSLSTRSPTICDWVCSRGTRA